MKKHSVITILLYAVLIFLTCLIVAIIIKDAFNIDVDYLSASATFFAAFAAFLLYDNWREPYRAQKMLEERKDILFQIREFRVAYYKFKTHLDLIPKEGWDSKKEEYIAEYLCLEACVLNNLDNLSDFLHIYSINFNDLSKNDRERLHKIELRKYSDEIIEIYTIFLEKDPNENFEDAYMNIVSSRVQIEFLKIVKNITLKLQKEILEYNKELEGQ